MSLLEEMAARLEQLARRVERLEAQERSGPPAGTIAAWGGSTAPAGWLLCDGTSYLRADYAALFAAIGTAYGAADGDHFNVPDLRDRVPKGKGAGTSLGDTAGSLTHTHADHTDVVVPASGASPYKGNLTAAYNVEPSPHTHTIPAISHAAGSSEQPDLVVNFVIRR